MANPVCFTERYFAVRSSTRYVELQRFSQSMPKRLASRGEPTSCGDV